MSRITAPLVLACFVLAGSALGQWKQQPAAPLPQELSLPNVSSLAALKAKYLGKQVWLYGGGPLTCVTSAYSRSTLQGVPWAAVRVQDIGYAARPMLVRVSRTNVVPPPKVNRALLLTLKVDSQFKVNSTISNTAATATPELITQTACESVIQPFVDEDHLRRLVSLTPPPAEIRDLWKRHSNLGLTHWQMLWLQGPPDSPPLEPVANLLEAMTWVNPGPPGYGDWVTTFQNDRVVKETAPAQMP